MSTPDPQRHDLKGGGQLLAVLALALVVSVAIGVGYALTLLPDIRAQRIKGNEAAAVESLIRIKTAQTLFRERPDAGPQRYGDLKELEAAGFLDLGLADQPRQGYVFEAGTGPDPTRRWWARATPQFQDRTGRSSYFVDQSGLVYVSEGTVVVPPPAEGLPPGLKPIGQ